MSIKDKLPVLEPDGLLTPEVGEWAYKKYLRVWIYDEIFATAMKNQWRRVYIDLFAGAGRVQLRDSRQIVPNAALLALDIPDRFDRYIFCEKDTAKMAALRERVAAVAPGADVHFVEGDSNETVTRITALIPDDALSFCFVDPYGVNIRLETIRRLSRGRKMDFLILLALQMDANRNRALYMSGESRSLEEFLGDTSWRAEWEEARRRGEDFRIFLGNYYIRAMATLGYVVAPMSEMYEMKTEKGLSIYYLAFFSKHLLGRKFWKEALKYSDEQTSMFDGLGF